VLVVVFLGLAGWNGWQYWQKRQATGLGPGVRRGRSADGQGCGARRPGFQRAAGQVRGHGTGRQTALLMAKASVDAGKLDDARLN
jgi:predicted negative regulator of RcsB-dependent stress response